MDKNEIRRKIKAMKSLMLDREKIEAAEAVFNQLEKTAAFILADKILMYHSLPDELSTRLFLRKWAEKKKVLFAAREWCQSRYTSL